MLRATEMAQLLLAQRLKKGDCAVDATVGNGNDTIFLANQVGPTGQVLGFDVQRQALDQAAQRLGTREQVRLVHAGHEHLREYLDSANNELAAVMFNLGYLPGSDKTITTGTKTTFQAIQQGLTLLAVEGVMTVVLYPGHTIGAEEAHEVLEYAHTLQGDFVVSRYHRLNTKKSAPELLVIERRR